MTGRSQRSSDRTTGEPAGEDAAERGSARFFRDLRILEVGDVAMFKQAVPGSTELVWTGPDGAIEGVGRPTGFDPRRLPALRRAFDRAEFDLVVGHVPPWSPWDPRRVVAMLRRFRRRAPALVVRSLGIRLLARPTRTPLAVLDLGDPAIIRPHNFALLDRARVYFKRELPTDRWKVFAGGLARDLPSRQQRTALRFAGWCAKLQPISLAVSPARAADIAVAATSPPEKTVDVFFAGQVESSSTVRTTGLPELRALGREGIRVDLPPERLDRREFYRRCARAWITWSPEGHGWECFRHYEAALCGSVPLMNQPSIVRHAPLRADEHALYYHVEPGDLARSVRAALVDRSRLGRMAASARTHVRRHHMLDRLCEHVVRACLDGAPGARPGSIDP